MHLTPRKEYGIPNTLLRVHSDHLATPRAVTRGDGTTRKVLWRWEGDAFGDVAPTKPTASTFTLPVRMAGQYFDSEVGISYNYFRDYDPSAGRYVQSDPIGLQGGMNTYGYVGGNALVFTDSKGLQRAPNGNWRPDTGGWKPPRPPLPNDIRTNPSAHDVLENLPDGLKCMFTGCLPADLTYCRIARCYTCERGEWFEDYEKDSFAIPAGMQFPPTKQDVEKRKECKCVSTGIRSNKNFGPLPGL